MEWTTPRVEWRFGLDTLRHHQGLLTGAELLTRWVASPSGHLPTDCFRLGDDYWIWQPGLGGIRFKASEPSLVVFPAEQGSFSRLERLIEEDWLPAIYQVWGRQVLHASAAFEKSSRRVVAFTGPSGAGKSTLAYALARRPGWTQLADDTLAFSLRGASVDLHPLRNQVRLRPATAAYHGQSGVPPQRISWPEGTLSLALVFMVAGDSGLEAAAEEAPLSAAESYVLLLQQAHAFTLQLPELNQQLMRDYLGLNAAAPMRRLRYCRSFERMDAILDVVLATCQNHASIPVDRSAREIQEISLNVPER